MKLRHFLILVSASALTLFFQNCSGVDFQDLSSQASLEAPLTSDPVDSFDDPVAPPLHVVWKTQKVELKARQMMPSKVDILFVVDNSRSMIEEQKELASRVAGFIHQIKDLSWHIAVTTTDARDNVSWGDGKFRELSGPGQGRYFLSSDLDSVKNAQDMLVEAIQTGISGSGDERGINAVYRSIERRDISSYHRAFYREDAVLAVILISDEDECSKGNCLDKEVRSRPEELVGLVQSKFGSDKIFNFHSIIKIPGDSSCKSASAYGNTYHGLSQMTGGLIGSVCSSNYISIVDSIGQNVIEMTRSANLACPLVDANGDGRPEIRLTGPNGQVLSSGFEVQGMLITFDENLPAGSYRIDYACRAK